MMPWRSFVLGFAIGMLTAWSVVYVADGLWVLAMLNTIVSAAMYSIELMRAR